MKILHLIYTNGIAGAEKYLMHLLPSLKKDHGIDCHLIMVIAPGFEEPFKIFCNEIREKGIQAQLLIARKKNIYSTASTISRYLKDNGIDYLHSHLLNSDVMATLVKMFFNRKLVLISTKHGYRESILKHLSDTNDMGFLKKIAKKEIYYYITKFIVRKANYNYAVSKTYSKLYYDLGLTRVVIPFIHHGITIPSQPKGRSLNKFRLADKQLIIVGRLEEVKGHKYLFKAMTVIVKKYPGCRLLIIGQGSMDKHLRELAASLQISDNVTFLGFQKDPYSYINNSDVAALPFLFESFGLVYIEAFALQTPVVAFDTPAGNEIMVNEETALLVPARDVAALTEKILSLLDDPSKAEKLVERAYKAYCNHFTSEKMVESTALFYKNILRETRD